METQKNFNREKLSKLKTANQFFNEKYGKRGTEARTQFEAEAVLFTIGVFIKESRLNENMTQKDLAEKTGLKRSYISKVEKGETDIQVSNLFKLLLGLDLNNLDLNKIFSSKKDNICLA